MTPGSIDPKIREKLVGGYWVDPKTGCWLWLGEINRNGYGTFVIRPKPGQRKRKMAHIEMYVMHKGEYDRQLLLDHQCRNRPCCNPDHLEPVTPRVNTLRGEAVLFKKNPTSGSVSDLDTDVAGMI